MSYDPSVDQFGNPVKRKIEKELGWFTPLLVSVGAAAILFLSFGPTERAPIYNYCPTDGKVYKVVNYMGRKAGSPPTVTALNLPHDRKELERLEALQIKCPQYR